MTIYQYGDADLNGKVQSRDVSYIKQYVVKLRKFSALSGVYANAYMDFEEDGTTPKINSRDAGIKKETCSAAFKVNTISTASRLQRHYFHITPPFDAFEAE